jgi:predicted ATPase
MNAIDKANKPIYTLVLPGNQKKNHYSLSNLGETLNDLIMQIMTDPDTDKNDKLKKIKKAFSVNDKIINDLSTAEPKILEEITHKVKRFEHE